MVEDSSPFIDSPYPPQDTFSCEVSQFSGTATLCNEFEKLRKNENVSVLQDFGERSQKLKGRELVTSSLRMPEGDAVRVPLVVTLTH